MMKGSRFVESPAAAAGLARSERRAILVQNGLVLADSVGLPAETTEPTQQIKRLLRSHLDEIGVKDAAFLGWVIEPPRRSPTLTNMLAMKGSFRVPRATYLAIGRLETSAQRKTPALAGIELVQYDNSVLEKRFRSR